MLASTGPILWLLSSWLLVQGAVALDRFHLENLPLLSLTNRSETNLLLPFNTTRTPGSKESLEVQRFIKAVYGGMQGSWRLEEDSFEANGRRFKNLVFTTGGDASRYVVLAAHYDSKVAPEGFIGASDSAASCAILMYVSRFLDTLYAEDATLLYPRLRGSDVGFKIVFFDGEEALQEWSAEDSLYGSRRLASQWLRDGTMRDVELFVLLDLLGGEPQPVKSYFRETHWHYERLASLEAGYSPHALQLDPRDHFFLQRGGVSIEDDHLPFYEAGVHVLHLVPWPFPSVWHTLQDDFAHLEQDQVDKWAVLLCEFVVQSFGAATHGALHSSEGDEQ